MAVAVGLAGACIIVPGPDSGVSTPGIGTCVDGEASRGVCAESSFVSRCDESAWPKQIDPYRLIDRSNKKERIRKDSLLSKSFLTENTSVILFSTNRSR